ncbi:transcription elongation factor GreA [Agromyces badenianii]|uniref:Transcription elongation factor GreA n=1 Tax=Agromyces badenianii TaxID=2080742 RepID=A0A2S0WVC1_9MICO|nr:GreA/GreB family elongation factor [Agromyces badenianii]AWB95295.1 transcription elongation factor GreA [Agromyces badenianii]PWC04428.1 transcription elongation factor GreA [Agromyces badenianii]
MNTESVWMTPAALERLEAELAELSRPGRTLTDIEQARATELRTMVRNAEVGRKPDDGLVEPGMRVTVRFDDDESATSFLLGSRELADLDTSVDLDVYSPTSPLGAAIAGRYVGDAVTYEAPNRSVRVTVLEAVPFG